MSLYSQLFLRETASPYGDINRNSTLSFRDLDQNFLFLKERDINQLRVVGSDLIYETLGGDTYSVNIGGASTDTFVTGFTFNTGTNILTIKQNEGQPDLTTDLTSLSSDVYVLSGAYNPSTGDVEFTNSTGGTFVVSGFTTGMTDSYTDAATLNGNIIEFDNNVQGSNYYNVDLTPVISGFTTAGSNDQIPYSNAAGTNFDYSNNFMFNGNYASIGHGSIDTNQILYVRNQISSKDTLKLFDGTNSATSSIQLTNVGSTGSGYKRGINMSVKNVSAGGTGVQGIDLTVADSSTTAASDVGFQYSGLFIGADFTTNNGYGAVIQTKAPNSSKNTALYLESANSGLGGHTALQLVDGTEGSGKFLKSDASGNSNWDYITSVDVSGVVETSLFNTYTGDTETTLNSKVETASNVGSGEGIFSGKSGTDLQFKSLRSAGGTVTITSDATTVNLESTSVPTFGSIDEIPVTNSSGTGFDYSSRLKFDGNSLITSNPTWTVGTIKATSGSDYFSIFGYGFIANNNGVAQLKLATGTNGYFIQSETSGKSLILATEGNANATDGRILQLRPNGDIDLGASVADTTYGAALGIKGKGGDDSTTGFVVKNSADTTTFEVKDGGTVVIPTIGSGTSVTNLGVDASGNVVSGTTGSGLNYISDVSAVATNLENTSNWNMNGVYTGTTATGVQGDSHYDDDYWFTCVATNTWIRLIRG